MDFPVQREGLSGWNDLTIIARGTHVKTVVNGVVCADWDGTGILDNAAHRERNVGRTGHFALQLHTKDQLRIRFKDIFVRELDHGSASDPKPSPRLPIRHQVRFPNEIKSTASQIKIML